MARKKKNETETPGEQTEKKEKKSKKVLTQEEQFQVELSVAGAKDDYDYLTHSVFADWCDDKNTEDSLELSRALRWLAANKKCCFTGKSDIGASWFNVATINAGLEHSASNLPADIYLKLEGGKEVANHKSYANRLDAEKAAQAAFIAAVKDGWIPVDMPAEEKKEKKT